MNIQAMMQQANKMKKELEKKQKEIEQHVFTLSSSGGAITVEMYGARQIKSLNIDKDALDPDEKEMLEEMIIIALNEVNKQIDQAYASINQSLGMLGF